MTYREDAINRITEGMDVYDANGDKIGSVASINIGTHTGDTLGQSVTEERSFFEVTSGLFGLGDDLYIPADAIAEVGDNDVRLKYDKDSDEFQAYGSRPTTPEPGGNGNNVLF